MCSIVYEKVSLEDQNLEHGFDICVDNNIKASRRHIVGSESRYNLLVLDNYTKRMTSDHSQSLSFLEHTPVAFGYVGG